MSEMTDHCNGCPSERERAVKRLKEKYFHGLSMEDLRKAIDHVVAYFDPEERNDFFFGDHECPLEDHVYSSILILEAYLKHGFLDLSKPKKKRATR